MADQPADLIAEKDTSPVCPVCGCDKPKALVDGRYQCVDCTCSSSDVGWGALEDG